MRIGVLRFGLITAAALAVAAVFVAIDTREARAQATDVGYRGPSYADASPTNKTFKATASKPQSKLWFNDGVWWGSLYSKSAGAYTIHRYDTGTHEWTDTGTPIDEREGSRADTLWDGEYLYVATAGTRGYYKTEDSARLMRYSYDPANKKYTLDDGFPVRDVSHGGAEAIVLEKDSSGELWVTYTENQAHGGYKVWVNHSQGTDQQWIGSYVLPVDGVDVAPDDISSIISYDLNTQTPQIGVMWSNQNDDTVYFSSHRDGDPDGQWKPSQPVVNGPKSTDDHINIKSLHSDDQSGRVFATIKTSNNDGPNANPDDPLIYLADLSQRGDFSKHVFGTIKENHTRPIVMVDEENRELYVLATSPISGGSIYYKKTPISDISFPAGKGTKFIESSTDPSVNDITSTKQNLGSDTGLLGLASDETTGYYLHNYLKIAGPPKNAAPVANDDSYDTNENENLQIGVGKGVLANDTDEDSDHSNLTAVTVTKAKHGEVVLNKDGSFSYTPDQGFSGKDTFSYTVNDDSGGVSNEATVTINVAAVNQQPPQIEAIPDTSVTAGEKFTYQVNATDPDGTISSYKASGLPDGLSIDQSGKISGTVAANAAQDAAYGVTVTATDNDGASAQASFNLTVSKVEPGALSGKDIIRFGRVKVGHDQEVTTTLKNSGGSNLTVRAVRIFGPEKEQFTATLDGKKLDEGPLDKQDRVKLAPGESMKLTLTLTPERTGRQNGRLVIGNTGAQRPYTAKMQGLAERNGAGCTIVGTPGDDHLVGRNHRDVICGRGGDDTIYGLGGNDSIRGGGGDDTIRGNTGNDTLLAGPGNDLVSGGRHADIIIGGAGEDTLRGNKGRDVIRGNRDNDTIHGGGGPDWMHGGFGRDTLNARDGVKGNDTVIGGPGRDECKANPHDTVRSCP